MNNKEITIYDLAKQLNLSATTVSRGLRGYEAINKKTRLRIEQLATELGYQRNKFASNLRVQRTHTIGVIVPKLNSLFISSVLSGIEKIVNKANYNLIISQSFEKELKEKNNVQTMFNSRVDALIISLSTETEDFGHFDGFLKKKIPIILFDRVTDQIPSTKVVIDNFRAGYIATEHLIMQGYKDIVHITGSMTHSVYKDRFEGYRKALDQYGIAFDPSLMLSVELTEPALRTVLLNDVLKRDRRPDALFITNDSCAAIAQVILGEEGLSVPDDMAIVGFNNDLISRVTSPAITTIHYPGYEMGETIGELVIEQLTAEGGQVVNKTVILDSDLLVRSSSVRRNG
ncbi:LacI family transcriptional regulator [Pedobacter frigiditerrae]|uniref:LacI family transcriptional regulator n=2 Tax=Pedobacter frigiditerrae TaxID=2530452 RepID=A0A4R0MS02_9SPHI|nr:LacI family transcriptional regulator [Pedobacter frigiditerrae]